MTQNDHVQISEVHRAVGAIVAAATTLELGLADAVASLSRSPLTKIIVQGERGNTLISMAKRLLDRGIGASEQDEASGRSTRLGLVPLADTAAFREALEFAERVLRTRDDVVHSQWLANLEPGRIYGQRTTRTKQYMRTWTLDELESARQALANAQLDVFICTWNTSGSGMSRMDPRQGDVM